MVQLSDTKGDNWNEMAKIYQKLTVDVSAKPISVMLERANAILPFTNATGVLDNGCGPAPIMTRILSEYKVPQSATLTCSDFSEGMIQRVKEVKQEATQKDAGSQWSRVEAVVQNAMDLESIRDASQSHVTAGWVYFMTPNPQKCLEESKRVLNDGGALSCSSWQSSQWMDMMNLLPTVRPDKKTPDLPREWMSAEGMKAELEKAGFRDVESCQVHTGMSFEKLESLVDFILEKMPHIVLLLEDFSAEDKSKLKALMMAEGRKMCPDDPGRLTGISLVAVGRK